MGSFARFFIAGIHFLSSLKVANASPSLNRRTNTVPRLVGGVFDMTSGGGGTYPRANLLANGNLIGTYTSFSDNDNIINSVLSTNGGVSWTPLGIVKSGASDANDIDNPYILELPSGRILVAIRNHSKDPTTEEYTFYRITIFYSDDCGITWAFLSQPASDPAGPNGNWEPFLRNALDGSLQIYYSRENSASDQDTLMRTSIDSGLTWSAPTTISGTDITSRDGMPGVATIAGSTLIAVFESEQNGLFTVNYILSPDDGVTWGDRTLLYTPTGTNNNAGTPQVIDVSGLLVVSFMTDEDTGLHDWVTGADTKILVSGDGGVTWGNKITVFEVQANWPGLVALNSGNFLVIADFNGSKSQEVTLT